MFHAVTGTVAHILARFVIQAQEVFLRINREVTTLTDCHTVTSITLATEYISKSMSGLRHCCRHRGGGLFMGSCEGSCKGSCLQLPESFSN